MRLKYFLISLMVLVATTVSLTALLVYYFQDERKDFIDDQIRQTAAAILDSKLSDLPAFDYEKVDSIISEELGPDRIGKFFILRNKNGEILFQSQNVSLLHLDFPREPQWVTLEQGNRLIRYVNLQLPRSKTRTIQVGVIAESSFFYWSALDGPAIAFLLTIPAVFLFMTWILSASLFAPLKAVSNYVKDATRSIESNKEVPGLPQELATYLKESILTRDDEFRDLLGGIARFADKINSNNKFTRRWTHQMVHELKTPLTLLKYELESLTAKHSVPQTDSQAINQSLDRISRTITNFLDWAELTYQGQSPNLHVVKISSVVQPLVVDLMKMSGERLTITGLQDFQVLCDPTHLEQLMNNLITNALKYSSDLVQVEMSDHTFAVFDRGPGLPSSVLENIGSPFNRGPQAGEVEGSGLGLAWVRAICDLYGWKLSIETGDTGSKISVGFPRVEAS